MRNQGIKLPLLHPVTWTRDILDPEICSNDQLGAILCGMWAIWTARNRRRHGETPLRFNAASKWAISTAIDLINEENSKMNPPPKRLNTR